MPAPPYCPASNDDQVIEVPAARLARGSWCHESQKQLGEGDISQSYSGDTIMEGRVRKPFRYRSELFVSVGNAINSQRRQSAKAYRLLLVDDFAGVPTTYREVTRDSEAARKSPLGFYHGITVRRGGEDHVLCGPPAVFVGRDNESAETQLDLF